MTLFAGIIARGAGARAVPEHAVEALRSGLSRCPRDHAQLRTGPGYALTWVELGLAPGPSAYTDASGATTLLAGTPLLDPGTGPRSRDLETLHEELCRGATTLTRTARGSFCAAHLDPATRRIRLVADKLALRPLYYAALDDYLLFATSLRVLEQNPLVANSGDLQALAEMACLGFPIGGRTPLEQVRTVEPGQIVEVLPDAVRTSAYWRWDEVPQTETDPERACDDIRTAFMRAIELRLGERRRTVSLLSGGLDSRCVVACLRALGAEVHTIGFGPTGSADQVLSRRVSQALGTEHFEMEAGAPDIWQRLIEAHGKWRESRGAELDETTACHLWTGEGGDRVLAPVNLCENVIAAMRAGDPDRAIATYLRAEGVAMPRRIFRREAREGVRSLPHRGIRAEIERYANADRARRFHMYVLCNEARRNVARHYEDLDLRRIELLMPFYDSELVRVVLRYPIDLFVRHRLYHRWLERLPPAVMAVPWQAYPSSEPCPMSLPDGVRSQWEAWYNRHEIREKWRMHVSLADSVVAAAEFPDWLLHRGLLHVARGLLKLGFRRFGYLFDVAHPFVAYPPQTRSLMQS